MDSTSETEEETKEKKMYTDEEFKEGCQFNLFLGAMIGMSFTLLTELAYAWYHGWIW